MRPSKPNGPVRLRFRMCGDFRNTAGFWNPSGFSRMRARPSENTPATLVRIRCGCSRPSRLPAVTLTTEAVFLASSVIVPVNRGRFPP